MIARMSEPCCCDRCGIELPEWDSTCPSIGTWAGSYLCRPCHYDTTGTRVKKKAKPVHKKISRPAMEILIRIDATAEQILQT